MSSNAVLKGFYRLQDGLPHLIAKKCQKCGTYYFPASLSYCRNPDCDSDTFDEVLLSRRGRLWSFTKQYYAPPPPYVVSEGKTFEPYVVAAVMLEEEKMIVLGQIASAIDEESLSVGDVMELIIEPLYEDKDGEHLIWKWKHAS